MRGGGAGATGRQRRRQRKAVGGICGDGAGIPWRREPSTAGGSERAGRAVEGVVRGDVWEGSAGRGWRRRDVQHYGVEEQLHGRRDRGGADGGMAGGHGRRDLVVSAEASSGDWMWNGDAAVPDCAEV